MDDPPLDQPESHISLDFDGGFAQVLVELAEPVHFEPGLNVQGSTDLSSVPLEEGVASPVLLDDQSRLGLSHLSACGSDEFDVLFVPFAGQVASGVLLNNECNSLHDIVPGEIYTGFQRQSMHFEEELSAVTCEEAPDETLYPDRRRA